MNGKKLRRMHRAAMFQDGGLVQVKDHLGKKPLERTDRYVPLRKWLLSQGNKQIEAEAKVWLENKQLQKPRRRIVGPNDPHSPSRIRRSRQLTSVAIARAETLAAERKAAKAS